MYLFHNTLIGSVNNLAPVFSINYSCIFAKRNYRVLVRVSLCVCICVCVCVCVCLRTITQKVIDIYM